ncbi:hypothetical protein BGX31_005259 [Mortierella sp. GBA43]|nr:hypothetical protein BGX31_005259 [Mortierella sp. GBA43]
MDSRELGFPGYMVYCGLMGSLTSLSIGYVIGSPNVPEKSIRGHDGECGPNPYTKQDGFPNCFEFADLLWGFAVGSFCLGALAGGLMGGTVQNIYGRRKTMSISNVFFIVGSLLLGLTYHQAQFIVGRIVVGFACGLGESPRWLVSKNMIQEGRDALQKLRGVDADIEHEFSDIVQLLLGHGANAATTSTATDSSNGDSAYGEVKKDAEVAAPVTRSRPHNYSIPHLFSSECRGLAIVGILVHFFQQASGINGLIYYSTTFLGNVFGDGNSKYITVGVSCCNLLATLASVFLIDRTGRRTLLLVSLAGVALSSLLLVAGAYADVGVLVVVAVFLYTAFFAVGLGPIPWLLLSEMLPTYALSPASAVATAVNWLTNFVIGLVFPSLNKGLGNGTFILFASITGVGFFYIWYFVPETKARPIEDIMAEKGVAPRSSYD